MKLALLMVVAFAKKSRGSKGSVFDIKKLDKIQTLKFQGKMSSLTLIMQDNEINSQNLMGVIEKFDMELVRLI